MDTLERIWDSIRDAVPDYILGAILLLIVGWIVAWILSKIVEGALRRTGLGERLGRRLGGRDQTGPDASGVAGRVVFYVVMLLVVIAVLDRLRLPLATAPLTDLLSGLLAYIPRLIGAALLAVLAWVIATILRTVVFELSRTARLDERLGAAGEAAAPAPSTAAAREAPPAAAGGAAAAPRSDATGADETRPASTASGEEARSVPPVSGGQATAATAERWPLSRALGEIVFALVLLLFLPAILDALALGGLLEPVNELLNTVLGFLPNVVAAGLILLIGWFVARFVSRLITNLLAAVGVDRLSERIGLAAAMGGQRLSGLLGLVVYILILIPVITAALNALQLPAVTEPASAMLADILAVIPKLLAAAAILAIAYAVGRVVSTLVTNLLTGVGFNRLPARLGFGAEGAAPTGWMPARVVGTLVLAAFIWFALIEALEVLGLDRLTALLAQLLVLAGQILLGLVIFAVGVWLARLAARAIRNSGTNQPYLLAFAAQAAILVLFGAMALRQMGVANEIINLAFGILLGAIGIAIAIAFGVGGREVAGRQLERWVSATQTGELDRAARAAIADGDAPPSPEPTTS